MSLVDTMESGRRVRALIEELLADPRQLGPDYQPIRRLADDVIVGVKATGRGRAGTELGDTLSLLDGARELGLVERLDWAFRCLAFDDFATRRDLELHITPEKETYGGICPPRLAGSFAQAKTGMPVVAEVHADAFANPGALTRAVEEFRRWGWKVVVADIGDTPSALDALDELRPDIVQLDLARPGRTASAAAGGVRRLLAWAAGAGAQVMALGVDSSTRRTEAVELGATTGRGALLGSPGPLPG